MRFSVRRFLVVIALVAALIGYVQEHRRRSRAYLERAEGCVWRSYLPLLGRGGPYDAKDYQAYYEQLRLKYERASRYPWLPVEPDGPEPALRPLPPEPPRQPGPSPFDLDSTAPSGTREGPGRSPFE